MVSINLKAVKMECASVQLHRSRFFWNKVKSGTVITGFGKRRLIITAFPRAAPELLQPDFSEVILVVVLMQSEMSKPSKAN